MVLSAYIYSIAEGIKIYTRRKALFSSSQPRNSSLALYLIIIDFRVPNRISSLVDFVFEQCCIYKKLRIMINQTTFGVRRLSIKYLDIYRIRTDATYPLENNMYYCNTWRWIVIISECDRKMYKLKMKTICRRETKWIFVLTLTHAHVNLNILTLKYMYLAFSQATCKLLTLKVFESNLICVLVLQMYIIQ